MNINNFSIWADYIERSFVLNELPKMVKNGIVTGATSNPAIFKNAFTSSSAYSDDKKRLNLKGKDLYEALAIEDIKLAANVFSDTHKNNRKDGFVSIEVDPTLCDDHKETVKEGKKLFKAIGMKNVMIKVPATKAGYIAIEELLKEGINVNATLVFKTEQTQEILKALDKSGAKSDINLVISIFISRFDRVIDSLVEDSLRGKSGIYNGANHYNIIKNSNFDSVRTLFASTGVKGDEFKKGYYISSLLATDSINTAPLDTIDAFYNDNDRGVKLPICQDEIDDFFKKLQNNNIDFDSVGTKLLKEGLDQFKVAFADIMKSF